MTPLRQRMTEDMQVRNLSPHTQTSYLQQVSLFARHFNKSPEQLGPENIRAYQVYLTNERKLSPSSILIAVSALRFLYKVSLRKDWTFDEIIPAPKKPQKLPVVLSPEEVLHFLQCVGSTKHRAILTTCYAAGLRISESVHLKPTDVDSQRIEVTFCFGILPRTVALPNGDPCRAREGTEGSIRDALSEAAGDAAPLLAGNTTEGLAVPRGYSGPADRHKRRRTGLSEGSAPLWHSQANQPSFHAPRVCRPFAGIRNRRPHNSTTSRPPQPGNHGPLPPHRHQQGMLHFQPA
jgi:hypothetical protein